MCADWALFFYALKKTNFGQETGFSNASLFYIGTGIGRMLIAPMIGVFFDRFPKRIMSVLIDTSYALLLVSSMILFYFDALNDYAFLAITILVHSFSQVHMQSVGFSAVKKRAAEHGGRYLALMFSLSTGLGIGVSGVIFSFLGFYGCMAFGVMTFIPIIFLYSDLFSEDESKNSSPKNSTYLQDIMASVKFLVNDKVLLKFALVLGVFNLVGALFPAYLKLEINNSSHGSDHLAAIILAGGLFVSTAFYGKIDRFSKNLRSGDAFIIALAPTFLAVLLAFIYPNTLTLSILYICACFGSGLRNIITAGLRTKRVPAEQISGVNTIYGAILNIGPLLGGIFVIPVVENSIERGLNLALFVLVISIIISFLLLPKSKVSELSKEAVSAK